MGVLGGFCTLRVYPAGMMSPGGDNMLCDRAQYPHIFASIAGILIEHAIGNNSKAVLKLQRRIVKITLVISFPLTWEFQIANDKEPPCPNMLVLSRITRPTTKPTI
jgi:hypothetical protein